jgi:probable HAF family extracellular repeat protein
MLVFRQKKQPSFNEGVATMTTPNLLATVALGLLLGVPGPVKAQFNFTTIDVPGSTRTAVNGNSTNAIVGEFDDATGDTHGFVLSRAGFFQIDHPDADGFTTVNGINANGELAGIYNDGTQLRGFFWSKGTFTTINPFGSIRTSAFFLNAKGQVAGVYRDAANTRHGFVWSKGVFTFIDVPGASAPAGTSVVGINDHGQIVGTYADSAGDRHGFVWSKGVFTDLDAPGADAFTVAQGINNAGDIVGLYVDAGGTSHGFLLSKGVYTPIDVPGAAWTEVYSINSKGEIVGAYEDEDGVHGFVGTPAR